MEKQTFTKYDRDIAYVLKYRGEYIHRISWFESGFPTARIHKTRHLQEILQQGSLYSNLEEVEKEKRLLKEFGVENVDVIELKIKVKIEYAWVE